jgi:hypothetical protein
MSAHPTNAHSLTVDGAEDDVDGEDEDDGSAEAEDDGVVVENGESMFSC